LSKLEARAGMEPAPPPEPPSPPECLAGYAKEEWFRVSPALWAMRQLTTADTAALGAYCEAYRRWRTAVETLVELEKRDPATKGLVTRTQGGGAAINPLVLVADRAARDMLRFASEFGFSPAARARISAGITGFGPPPGSGDKFAGLIGRPDLGRPRPDPA
jgi:P27 family predicted phage terminase small subunit